LRKLLPFFGSMFIGALHATLRVRHIGSDNIETQPRYIFAFWHAHLVLMLHARYRRPIAVLVSQSKDGDIISGVFDYYGVDVRRGSSTRGGSQAFREMLVLARDGYNLVFTPDGPTGPPRVAKEGVIAAAQLTGLPIVPVAFGAKKKSCSDRGTAPWCRTRSRKRFSCTASRSAFRAKATSKNGGLRLNTR
jgi:lysophospholipid acyltransferase (LPLAT)-like uncharacterized protein